MNQDFCSELSKIKAMLLQSPQECLQSNPKVIQFPKQEEDIISQWHKLDEAYMGKINHISAIYQKEGYIPHKDALDALTSASSLIAFMHHELEKLLFDRS